MIILPLLVLTTLWLPPTALAANCRCLPDSPCWPSPAAFARLASQLTQPLLHPVPPESACYPPAHPAGDCTAARLHTTDGIWRAAHPGAMQAPNFETHTFPDGHIAACYLDTSLGASCKQGSVPVVGVDARTVADVQAALAFARAHDLRVVVKSTGHDYMGRSTARGAFLIWTHGFDEIAYDEAFVPRGAPPAETYQAMTLGAGVPWRDAYAAIHARGRVLVGGRCETVGAAAGWVLGGGHSSLSPTYGLGVDNVLEFTLVTSTGALVTASAHVNPDLFWALRGGGGGTFGIVLSTTYRTHGPTPGTGQLFTARAATADAYTQLVAAFVRASPALRDAGWAGYVTMSASVRTLSAIMYAPGIPLAQANATWGAFASALVGVQVLQADTRAYAAWAAWFADLPATLGPGVNVEMGSRLLARDLVERAPAAVAQTLAGMDAGYLMVAGGAVAGVRPGATGLNPAWRAALAHVIVATAWPEGTSAAGIAGLRARLAGQVQALEGLRPGAGAYLNEASAFEEDPRGTFFGAHYAELGRVKRVYDPVGLFVVAEGVGSEEWDESLNCRL